VFFVQEFNVLLDGQTCFPSRRITSSFPSLFLFLFLPHLATRRVVTVDSDGVLWRIHLRMCSLRAEKAHSDSTKTKGKSATEELSSL